MNVVAFENRNSELFAISAYSTFTVRTALHPVLIQTLMTQTKLAD